MKADLMLTIIDIAPKIYGVFPLLALAIIIISFFQKDTVNKGRVVLLCSSIGIICLLGVIAHIYSSISLNKRLDELSAKLEIVHRNRDSLLVESQRLQSLKDTCLLEKRNLLKKNETLMSQNEEIKIKNTTMSDQIKTLKDEIKKHKGFKYSFSEGFAVVKNEDGMYGYLREGHSMSTVEYIYYGACKFSEGLAGVKIKRNAKWGFIDKSFGTPVINCIYDDPKAFENGRAIVTYKGSQIFIDRLGRKIGNVKTAR